MKRNQRIAFVLVLLSGSGLVAYSILNSPVFDGQQGQKSAEQEKVKGPLGGRLLSDGDFSAEIVIYEAGIPPEFRVYFYDRQKRMDPDRVKLTIELHRFAERVDRIRFMKLQDYLVGDKVVEEPHSFRIKVIAEHKDKTYRWEYESYEGRTELSPEAVKRSGIVVEEAGLAKMKTSLKVNGHIVPNEDKLTLVIPRHPGVVKAVQKRLGEAVFKGEVLAIIEKNESLERYGTLQHYEVTSPLTGTVIRKNVTPGKFVKEDDAIYVVSDLNTVWVDLNVYRQDFSRLKISQTVMIYGGEGLPTAQGKIAYLSSFGSEYTQSTLARVEVPNPTGEWRPGLSVTGEIVLEKFTVPVAVKEKALQRFRDWDVVFIQHGNLFEIAILELGRSDGEWVEVLSGLAPGQKYVTENSFVIKADIGKSGATHDH